MLHLLICLAVTGPSLAALNVVATTADLGAIAREIGADAVQVTVLAKPTEDVHFVDPKPSYVAKLSRADVLIEGGAELESGWLPPLLEGARNPKLAAGQPGRVACAEGLALLEVPTALDRSKGDLHAMGNPHFMTDPLNARHAAQRICAALSEVDREYAAAYRQRLDAFVKHLDDKLGLWQKQLEPFKGRRIVAFHNSWPYFARRFGLRIDLFLEPKPGIPPTPVHLAEVIATMKAEKVGVILLEPHQNRRTAETVSAKTGAAVLEFSQYPGGVKGTEAGYIELMDHLVSVLATAMRHEAGSKELQP
jgi:zinc/manganese transport system substrate-binding protein